jgi:hypothetical protein
MSHLYTSLAYTLNNYTKLLKKGSSGFRKLCDQISTNNFSGKQSDHQHRINFAMKKVAKMVSKHGHLYLVKSTMQDELNFFSKALSPDSGIKFEIPIAHLIPRTPTDLSSVIIPHLCAVAIQSLWNFGGSLFSIGNS